MLEGNDEQSGEMRSPLWRDILIVVAVVSVVGTLVGYFTHSVQVGCVGGFVALVITLAYLYGIESILDRDPPRDPFIKQEDLIGTILWRAFQNWKWMSSKGKKTSIVIRHHYL